MKYTFTALIFWFATSVYSQKLPFQGKLLENEEPVTGTKAFVFSIDSSWSESHSSVSVLDGFYSVILGETNPLPGDLFNNADERALTIQVGDETLSPITLYKPYPSTADSIALRDVKLFNEAGDLRTHLNVYEATDAGSLVLYGANDSTKVILGSSYEGYGGYLGLYDSLRYQGARLFVNAKGVGNLYTMDASHQVSGWFGNQGGTGGFMQLVGYTSGLFTGATYTGMASWNSGLPYFIMEGSSSNPYTTLLQFGGTKNTVGETSYFNMNTSNRALAGKVSAITMNVINDANGDDPAAEGAELFLYGDTTPNFQIGGQAWTDSDQAIFNMFGSKGDGNGWYLSNMNLSTTASGDYDISTLSMQNTVEGGSVFETIYLTSAGAAHSGQLLVRDSLASPVADLKNNGTSGELSLFSISGADALNMNAYGIKGGEDPYTEGFVLSENATNGSAFEMYSLGIGTITMYGNSGTINAVSVNQTSDARLKENIQPQQDALEKVKALRGVTFEWKADETNQQHLGFIAQEVEAVYPELVTTKPDGYKAVNYAVLVSALVEAVKALDAKMDVLQDENTQLKVDLANASASAQDIEQLKAEMASIRELLSLTVRDNSVGQNK